MNSEFTENILLSLYILGSIDKNVNSHTFERYLYLYYFSYSFFHSDIINLTLNLTESGANISGLTQELLNLQDSDLICISDNIIIVKDTLIEYVKELLKTKTGLFFEKYKKLYPVLILLNSYDDAFIFTAFFSEPSIKEAENRNMSTVKSKNSELAILLKKFKANVNNKKVDDYDILSHWIEYVLKEYHRKA